MYRGLLFGLGILPPLGDRQQRPTLQPLNFPPYPTAAVARGEIYSYPVNHREVGVC